MGFHAAILCLLIFNLDTTSPLPVFENTNKQDVISAVILGDVTTSKIIKKPEPKPAPVAPKPVVAPIVIPKKVLPLPSHETLAKNLLNDINKTKKQQKKINDKKLQAAFKKHIKEQAEKSLRQQLFDEKIKLEATKSRESQGEVNKYKALILQAISERWIVPPQANKKLYCELMIRLAPGGMVLDVQVTKSSGDVSLDHSARAAVLKASPLPVPSDPDAFSAFRQFVLKVKPENVISTDT